MSLFSLDEFKVTISAAYARQRFLCSAEYSAGVCHGACCAGPSVVLLTAREAADLGRDSSLPIHGQVLAVRGSQCPLSLPNGHCKYHGTKLQPFVCSILPFCLNNNGKLILDNRYMKRACRVRNGKEGGEPAYKCFSAALELMFGHAVALFIKKHLDAGGGDLTVPVSRSVMELLLWHRGIVNDIRKFGYKEAIKKLAGGVECL